MTYMISATRKTMLDSKLFSPQCYFIFLLCCVKKKKKTPKSLTYGYESESQSLFITVPFLLFLVFFIGTYEES